MKNINSISLSIAAAFLLGFGGCDSDDTTTTTSTTVTINGKVLDGYLDKATVCLDKNLNGQCDASEPSMLSINGSYTLSVSQKDKETYPIVVEAKAGVTVDLDTPRVEVENSYTLTSPIGKPDVVSPLTTLVKAEIDKNPTLSVEEASSIVSQTLDITSDGSAMLKDYIPNANTTVYAQLHEVAKAVVQFQVEAEAKIKSDLELDVTLSDIQSDALDRMVNEITMQNIKDIASEIKDSANPKTALELEEDIKNTITNLEEITSKDFTLAIEKIDLVEEGTIKLADTLEDEMLYSLDTLDEAGNEQPDINVKVLQFKDEQILSKKVELSAPTFTTLEIDFLDDLATDLTEKADESFSKTTDGAITVTNSADGSVSTITKVTTTPLTAKTYTLEQIADILKMTLDPSWNDKLEVSISFNSDDELYATTVSTDGKITVQYYFNKSALDKIVTKIAKKN